MGEPDRQNTSEPEAVAKALQISPLFAGLPPSVLREMAAFCRFRKLKKGQYLFHEAEKAEGFYIVHSGGINVHRVNAAGKEQVLRVFRGGEPVAEAVLAGDGGYPASARAEGTSAVVFVPRREFAGLLRRHPEAALRMILALGRRLRLLVELLEERTFRDAEARLAGWLLRRCPDPFSHKPAEIVLGMTKKTLAAEIGLAGETLSRALAAFREKGLAETRGQQVRLPNPLLLKKFLEQRLNPQPSR